ncbi:peptidoglycan-associated lipoprotein Pal [Algiphilus sp.]|uniref:peptidoglycan-associated lipoprotein Pal n=1 Tax=Algiphilus sp. TaxID=1872431 RepID=UPI0025BB1A5B|nr:peptidoglycan-associated lipoprotein Pal [Algiphilus sp.]MCK5772089.1 peptidoglycan-associated lipoprotein Pal [Algiphilus sp.]
MKTGHILLSALLVATLAGCSSTGKRDTSARSPDVNESGSTSQTSGVGAGDRGTAEPLPMSAEERMRKEQADLRSDNTVYFAFDSSDLKPEGMSLVKRHASFLTANPDVSVRLEGHTDERGTREYNIGLGERRSQSVARVLRAQGVGGDQISVVSYGEERPAQLGSNESAWTENRRVEIVYP